MRAFVLAAALLAAPSAFAIDGIANIVGFASPGPGGVPYSFVPSGEAKFWNGVAKTTAIVEAAGRTMRTEAAISRVAGAGRYVWAACSANIVVCAGGAAFVAYMMQSNITRDEETNQWGKKIGSPDGYQYKHPYGMWYNDLTGLCSELAALYSKGGPKYTLKSTTGAPEPGASGFCYYDVEGIGQSYGSYESRINLTPAEFRPVTQQELEEHFQRHEPSDDALNEAGASGSAVPSAAPQIAPVRSPLGEPYKNAQGQTRQDVMECKQTSGAASPLSMTCTTFSIDPATDSPTKATPAPQPPQPGASTPTGTAPPAQEKPVDLCAANPDIVACAKFGTVPQSETLPKKITPVNFISEPLGLPDACPAPIAGPGGVSIPFDSACEAFRMLRPLVVAMAAVLSMLMVVGALRTS